MQRKNKGGNDKISWWEPKVGNKYDRKLLLQVVDNNFPNQGPLTSEFENKVAVLVGTKYALATTSGTVAIFLALKAHDIGHGDEVIVPDITFIATANAVKLCGATPVFVDVDPETLQINAKEIESVVTKKTKAILPVHISGRGADMEGVLKIAKKHKLAVIEDAAEAFMSKRSGKFLGTFGDAGCFSLSPNKTITSGQGGIIVTNDDVIYNRLRELKNQGVAGRLSGGDDIHPTLGFNFKFTDLQAALALGQLTELKARLSRMKRNHELYKKHLKGIKQLKIFECDTKAGEIPQWTDGLFERRDELDSYLRERNIDCRRFWLPLHTQNPYKSSDAEFPVSTRLGPKSLWLPSAFTLTDDQIVKVCRLIKEFYKNVG